jgi:hypothetical protein
LAVLAPRGQFGSYLHNTDVVIQISPMLNWYALLKSKSTPKKIRVQTGEKAKNADLTGN